MEIMNEIVSVDLEKTGNSKRCRKDGYREVKDNGNTLTIALPRKEKTLCKSIKAFAKMRNKSQKEIVLSLLNEAIKKELIKLNENDLRLFNQIVLEM